MLTSQLAWKRRSAGPSLQSVLFQENGVSDNIMNTVTTPVPFTGGMSLIFWLKVNAYPPSTPTQEFGDPFSLLGTTTNYFYIEVSYDGQIYHARRDGSGGGFFGQVVISTGSVSAWQCIFLSCSGPGGTTTVRSRLEGASAWTTHGTISTPTYTPNMMSFGGEPGYGFGTYLMDGIKVYAGRALTESEGLIESQNLDVVDSTDIFFSNNCQSAATAQNNQSAGGCDDLIVTGALANDASYPNVA